MHAGDFHPQILQARERRSAERSRGGRAAGKDLLGDGILRAGFGVAAGQPGEAVLGVGSEVHHHATAARPGVSARELHHPPRHQSQQPAAHRHGLFEDRRLRPRAYLPSSIQADDSRAGHPLVPPAGTSARRHQSHNGHRHVGGWLHPRRTPRAQAAPARHQRNRADRHDRRLTGDAERRDLAGIQRPAGVPELHDPPATLQQPQDEVPVAVAGRTSSAELSLHVRPEEARDGDRMSSVELF